MDKIKAITAPEIIFMKALTIKFFKKSRRTTQKARGLFLRRNDTRRAT